MQSIEFSIMKEFSPHVIEVINAINDRLFDPSAIWKAASLIKLIYNGQKVTLKHYLKSILLEENNRCSYCNTSFHGRANIEFDIEHILPKFLDPRLVLDIRNLVLSCKTCNTIIKGDRTDFLHVEFEKKHGELNVNFSAVILEIFTIGSFRIITPRLECFTDFIVQNISDDGFVYSCVYIVIDPNNDKAISHYKYFELSKRNTSNVAKSEGHDIDKENKFLTMKSIFDPDLVSRLTNYNSGLLQ